jgi:hypothetical protein
MIKAIAKCKDRCDREKVVGLVMDILGEDHAKADAFVTKVGQAAAQGKSDAMVFNAQVLCEAANGSMTAH